MRKNKLRSLPLPSCTRTDPYHVSAFTATRKNPLKTSQLYTAVSHKTVYKKN